MRLRNKIRSFKANEDGHFAIMTAVLSVPLLIGMSAAMDYSGALDEQTSIKNALDNAVLAAATNNRASDSEKINIAKLHFEQNYTGRVDVSPRATSGEGRVDMWAEGLVPYSISDALGLDGIQLNVKSAAERSEKNVICVLALSESDEGSVTFAGGAKFFAPTCSVHSNSSSSKALLSSGTVSPIAKSFCASGGVKGSFSPYAKGQCLPIEDPYFNTPNALIETCVPDTKFKAPKEDKKANDTAAATSIESENATGSNITLYPGTYCKGLTIDGVNVRFMPGDYVILDGPLTFKNGGQAVAEDVTFGLSGDKAKLKIEKGANLRVKAPSYGPRKGLAFMEMTTKSEKSSKKKDKKKPKPHEIKSGGTLDVIGTVYFPTQPIKVSGSGTRMGSQAPATSFIAHTIEIDGDDGALVQVKVDHQSAGLPPLLPRAEDGAVLVE